MELRERTDPDDSQQFGQQSINFNGVGQNHFVQQNRKQPISRKASRTRARLGIPLCIYAGHPQEAEMLYLNMFRPWP